MLKKSRSFNLLDAISSNFKNNEKVEEKIEEVHSPKTSIKKLK